MAVAGGGKGERAVFAIESQDSSSIVLFHRSSSTVKIPPFRGWIMTEAEKKARRKQWNKIIARWKREKVDRSAFQIGTLDDETDKPSPATTLNERLEALMKLRWINYGPDALYGTMEKVLTMGQLEP